MAIQQSMGFIHLRPESRKTPGIKAFFGRQAVNNRPARPSPVNDLFMNYL